MERWILDDSTFYELENKLSNANDLNEVKLVIFELMSRLNCTELFDLNDE